MPGDSKIEWTDASWNPVTGCTKVSAGCDRCYAEAFAERWRGVAGHPYEQGFDLKLWPERLEIPLKWTRPRRIFVNSMSDLFHPGVPQIFIAKAFAIMEATPRHTFQVLTKRPRRMARMLADTAFQDDIQAAAEELGLAWPMVDWPAHNIWLGTSVENQEEAFRLDFLVKTPAAVRFVSCEPLIGVLDLWHWLYPSDHRLDWVIVGGESGPGARECDPRWIDRIVLDCLSGRVPCFVKQLGSVTAKRYGVPAKGGDMDSWPAELDGIKVREFPTVGGPR